LRWLKKNVLPEPLGPANNLNLGWGIRIYFRFYFKPGEEEVLLLLYIKITLPFLEIATGNPLRKAFRLAERAAVLIAAFKERTLLFGLLFIHIKLQLFSSSSNSKR
jgi:hypothetical protein